ncbi:MAG: mechanosensitive ion channel family protein [Myxococcaceae bacterium]
MNVMSGGPALLLTLLLALAGESLPPTAPSTLTFANRTIFTFRGTSGGITPQERMTMAHARLEETPVRGPMPTVEVRPLRFGDERATAVLVSSRYAFHVSERDLVPGSGETTDEQAAKAAEALREALTADRDQRSLRVLFRSLIFAGIGTVVAAGLLWLLTRGRRMAVAGAAGLIRKQTVRLWGIDFGPILRSSIRALVFVLFWALVLSLIEVWLTYVLSLFPLTKPWGDALLGGVTGLLSRLGRGLVAAIPGLVTAVVILLIGRGAASFVSSVVHRVEEGTGTLPGIYPETASATRRLLVGLVWLITIAAAYPYLPGSGSDAFKGMSLIIGLGLSLGSSGIVAQAMSGLVVIYSRALSRGDCVRIGETEGLVTEVNLLSTRLMTIQGEEVTFPNTVVVNGAVRNFGRARAAHGAIVSSKVSIGYDAPWRQVHGLLLGAAKQTSGLRTDPSPYVLQRSLDDFYVQYELIAWVDNPVDRPVIASVLNGCIQDAFNTAGVQIMSPHYVLQPRHPVLGSPAPAQAAAAQVGGQVSASGKQS